MAKRTEKKAARFETKKSPKSDWLCAACQTPLPPGELVKCPKCGESNERAGSWAKGKPQITRAESKAAMKAKPAPKEDVNKKNRDIVAGALQQAGAPMEKKSAYLKFEGQERRRAYVAIRGPMVTLAGFELRHAGVEAVSEAEAKKRHLGTVRGILYLDRQSERVVREVAGLVAHALRG